MKYLTGFFRFWYDFLIGDSWQIAVGVVIVILVTRELILKLPQLAPVIGPVFSLALLTVFCGVLLNEQRS